MRTEVSTYFPCPLTTPLCSPRRFRLSSLDSATRPSRNQGSRPNPTPLVTFCYQTHRSGTPTKLDSSRGTTLSRIPLPQDRSPKAVSDTAPELPPADPRRADRIGREQRSQRCVLRRRGRLMPFSNTSLSQVICRSGAEVASSGGQDARQGLSTSPSARTEQAGKRAEVSDYSREAYSRASSVGLEPPVNPHPRSRAQSYS